MKFIELNNQINEIADWWMNTKNPPPELVINARRKLTGILYFLEGERSQFHQRYEKIIFERKNEKSVNAAQNDANHEVPELYLLRRIMDAAYEISAAMASYVSYMKTERLNSNEQT